MTERIYTLVDGKLVAKVGGRETGKRYSDIWRDPDGAIRLREWADSESAARDAEEAAAKEPKPRRIDLSLLLEQLTREEKAAAGAFMLAHPDMLVDVLEASARGDFRSDNPDTGRFTEALVRDGVITRERLTALLGA